MGAATRTEKMVTVARSKRMCSRTEQVQALFAVATAALIVRLTYVLTYPFLTEGDGFEYYLLIQEARSHLLFAPGYPSLFGVLMFPARVAGLDLVAVLPWVQQGLALGAGLFVTWHLTAMLGRWIGIMFGLLYGIDFLAVSSAGLSRPEFLQAAVLCLIIGIIVRCCLMDPPASVRHALTIGVLFGVGYLAKYNFVSVIPLVLLLAYRSTGVVRALQLLGTAVASGVLVVAAFAWLIHAPQTGTTTLNLEHGWVHMHKLGLAGIQVEPEAGMASQKLLVLGNSLPAPNESGCCVRDPWLAVDAVPPEVRAEYRARWKDLLVSTDEDYIDRELANVEHISRDPEIFRGLYFYLGLHEAEDLLRNVFIEAIRHDGRRYVANVAGAFGEGLSLWDHYRPFVPVFEGGLYPSDNVVADCLTIRRDDQRFSGTDTFPVGRMGECLENMPATDASIYRPAAIALSTLGWPSLVIYRVVWLLAPLHALLTAVEWRRRQAPSAMTVLSIACYMSVFAALAFSALIFEFRVKELVLIQPLLWLLFSLQLRQLTDYVQRRRARQEGEAAGSGSPRTAPAHRRWRR